VIRGSTATRCSGSSRITDHSSLVFTDLLQPPVQREAGETQLLRRQTLVVIRQPQRLFDDRLFDLLEGLLAHLHLDTDDLRASLRDGRRRLFGLIVQLVRQVSRGERPALAENHGPLDDVLQLTDIAGIMVPFEQGPRSIAVVSQRRSPSLLIILSSLKPESETQDR
jgi:hypothetical protein